MKRRKPKHTPPPLDLAGLATPDVADLRTRTIIVDIEDPQIRLDKYLIEQEEGISRMRFKHLIEDGWIRVNGKTAKASQKVAAWDEIEVTFPAPTPMDLEPEAVPLTILYEDEHLVVVDKPAGMVVHPAAGHYQGTLVHALLHHCTELSGIGGVLRPGIVHRLDKGTSGVIVAAKNDGAHHNLQKMFKVHQMEKRYVALTKGVPRDREGTIQSHIARHPLHRQRMASVSDGGKRAVTHFKVLADYGRFAQVRLDLETGRTHQIRVHLSDRKTPVLGDVTYGGRPHPDGVRDDALRDLLLALDRPLLHAERLAFSHPITGEPVVAEAKIPPDMAAIIERLEAISADSSDA